jgi:hypothetical protein
VIRRSVLEALAQAAEAGEGDEGALARLRIDPVLAGRARRRLREAIIEALIDAPGVEGAPLARRAFLIVARRRAPVDVVDDALVECFAAARAALGPAPRVSYVATAATVAFVLAVCGLLGFALWRAAHPGPKDAWHRRAPAPSGAFASGGAPTPLPPAAVALLREPFVAFLLQLDRLTGAVSGEDQMGDAVAIDRDVENAAQELIRRCPDALGAGPCARLTTLLAAARQVGEHHDDASEHAFLDAVGALDDAFAAAGLPAYVDGDVITYTDGRRHVIVYSYAVEAVHLWRSGDHDLRGLWLRRLDALNFEQAAAGFVRPNLREALVLLDQSEDVLTTRILPALVEGGVVGFSPGEGAQYPGREALERAIADAMRREWKALLAGDDAAIERVAARFARREVLLDELDKQLALRQLTFVRPSGLRMPDGWFDSLRSEMPHETFDELERLDEELASQAAAAAFAAARARFAALVESHELQHRIDDLTGGLRLPEDLAAITGPIRFEGDERGGAASARDEMSAYLAQLARTPALARTSLAMIARFLLDRHLWGGAECDGALVIVAGLARELGLPAEPLLVQHFVDRGAVARALLAIFSRPPAEVSDAAARLWKSLYGVQLAQLSAR